MNKMLLAATAMAVSFGTYTTRAQQRAGDAPADSTHDSYYAASQTVELPRPIGGDVVVAGRVVTIAEEVTGDVLAAGWRVTVTAPAADDVRIAGREVRVSAPIAGDLTAAGGDVAIDPGTNVKGRVWLAGGTIRAAGTFEREARIAAGEVTLSGEVQRPTTIIAERLTIGHNARVLAPLTYEGPNEAVVETGATLMHPLVFRRVDSERARQARTAPGVSNIVFVVHLVVSGLLLLLVLPLVATEPARVLNLQPWRSLLVGSMLAVSVPFVAAVFIVTVVGIPVGLVLVAGYFVGLLLGILTTAFYVGMLEARLFKTPVTTRGGQIGAFVAGVVTLAVGRSVPGLGGLFTFAAVLFGLGAIGVWLHRLYLGAPRPTIA